MTSGSSQNVVSGNYIGLNRLGTAAIGNGRYGIFISSTGTTQNAIGGGSAAARNVISGNGGDGIQVHTGSSANQIVGNYVGTDVTGNVDLGNNGRGVYIGSGSNNVIGDVNGNGNLISGNSVGIQVDSSSNVQIVNNLVGVNAAGTGALGNTTARDSRPELPRRHRPAELRVCQWRQRHRAEPPRSAARQCAATPSACRTEARQRSRMRVTAS